MKVWQVASLRKGTWLWAMFVFETRQPFPFYRRNCKHHFNNVVLKLTDRICILCGIFSSVKRGTKLKISNITHGKDPMKSGRVSSRCVSGGDECPLCVGWWSNCRLPWRPDLEIRARCQRPFVIGTGDLHKTNITH